MYIATVNYQNKCTSERDLLSRGHAVVGLHVETVVFAGGVVGVVDLAFGLAAGLS